MTDRRHAPAARRLTDGGERVACRAHNASIISGYLDHRQLAETENAPERSFMNVALVRVLDATPWSVRHAWRWARWPGASSAVRPIFE